MSSPPGYKYTSEHASSSQYRICSLSNSYSYCYMLGMTSAWQITLVGLTLLRWSCFASRERRDTFHLGPLVNKIVQQHLKGCNIVLLSTADDSPLITEIAWSAKEAMSVIEATSINTAQLRQALLGDWSTTCRALVLNLLGNRNPRELIVDSRNNVTEVTLRLLELAGLWKMPETRVLVVNLKTGLEEILLHSCFRNSVHALSFVFHELPIFQDHGFYSHLDSDLVDAEMLVYRRCMYCSSGDPSVELMFRTNLTSSLISTLLFQNIFTDSTKSLEEHSLRVTTLSYFPYMDFIRTKKAERGSQVIPRDSLDARLLKAFAETLNFTYEHWEEPNRSFGDEKDGHFTGMIGELQREEADLSTIVAPTPGRLKAIDFLRLYPSDMMVIVSLKPSLLPAHLAVIRPFSYYVWISIVAGVALWVFIMITLQHTWKTLAGVSVPSFSTTLFYSWGALLEKPPADPSINISGQMMIGVWLVFCLIIGSAFRSSLIAHLTIKGMSKTFETLRDLVEERKWNWGTEPWLYNGAALEYFSKHPDPVVKKIHSEMKVLVADAALEKVMSGKFSFIIVKNYISVVLANRYTDKQGHTPFYISKGGFYFLASFGWAFRKGAPYYGHFQQLMHRLEDAGIISQWTSEVVEQRVRENRAVAPLYQNTKLRYSEKGAYADEVLGMDHLQGAFYLLFLGSCVAFVILVIENVMELNNRFMVTHNGKQPRGKRESHAETE
ncbi:glutamate receptor ionotropic, delta-2-like [Scylla paramamosain]|uniref:glutamate receptor ionotropic, delta-2-like n=1 Tax=Scylla paramamosain TaxID=85552 RepID=UPI003083EDF9